MLVSLVLLLAVEIVSQSFVQDREYTNRKFIHPGTKWCGSGNISKSFDDLGILVDMDRCCRAHDYCDDVIKSNETKHNLTNSSPYTSLSCQCDEVFRTCLLNIHSYVSNKVGLLYFNLLGKKCFWLDYPIIGCLKEIYMLRRKCLVYQYDNSKPKKYQWFDVPPYY